MPGPAGQDHVPAAPCEFDRGGPAQSAVGPGNQAGLAIDPDVIRNRADIRRLLIPEIPQSPDEGADKAPVADFS